MENTQATTAPKPHELDGAVLDGRLERARFAPGLTILVGLIVGFLAFQSVSLLVALGLILSSGSLDPSVLQRVPDLVARYARELLIGNTAGQIVGLLALAWLLARLHTRDAGAFLRLRAPDGWFTVLAVAGLLALVPVVQWLGTWSDALPWPDAVRDFESVQVELIEQVLAQRLGLAFTVATMAATPALCEEIFFRGYIQRQAERSFGLPSLAVVFSGVVFGLYHVRPTQALPLSALGIFLAYLVWRSGSLWPAVAVHFANNALAVTFGSLSSEGVSEGVPDLNALEIPAWVLLPAIVAFGAAVYGMERRGRPGRTNGPDCAGGTGPGADGSGPERGGEAG